MSHFKTRRRRYRRGRRDVVLCNDAVRKRKRKSSSKRTCCIANQERTKGGNDVASGPRQRNATRLREISERDFFNRENIPKVSTSPSLSPASCLSRSPWATPCRHPHSFCHPVSLQPSPIFLHGLHCRLLVSDLFQL